MINHASFARLIGTTIGNYRMAELAGESPLGPAFVAHAADAPATPYLLRLLAVRADMPPQLAAQYAEWLQQQAGHVAALQHPYILPLLEYGFDNGVPYLVYPYLPSRTLSARLAQNGPLDVLTAGRYLDQMAAALEYAHEHATLHRRLTPECVTIQLDGHLVVGDVGVRRMVELSVPGGAPVVVLGAAETSAPEQILGGRVDTYSDVYALGTVVYWMLAGRPPFSGKTADEVLQQQLRAPVPPLARWRAGLPAGLDEVIAVAMAKEPVQRFQHPGALANAYQEVVAPNRATRVPFIAPQRDDSWQQSTPGSGQIPPSQRTTSGSVAGALPARTSMTYRPAAAVATPSPASQVSFPGNGALAAPPAATPARPVRPVRSGSRGGALRLAVFVVVVLALIAGTLYGLTHFFGNAGSPGVAQVTGTIVFTDSQAGPAGHTDALQITIHGLGAPPDGSQYDAWIIDSHTEAVHALGTLVKSGNTFVLRDQGDSKGGQPGTNLLSLGDRFEITNEQGNVSLPVGKSVLIANDPPQAWQHILHLLVGFPTTPGQIGLAQGVLQQSQLLSAQAQALQNAVASHNQVAQACLAQSMVDIIEGAHGSHYQPLSDACTAENVSEVGDGFGLAAPNGYTAIAAEHASNAAIAPDSTAYIRLHAGHVQIAMNNIQGWITTIDQDALRLLANPATTALAGQMATLADHAYRGTDTNGDESIDPVPGEAGAVTGYEHAQLMAALTLVAAT